MTTQEQNANPRRSATRAPVGRPIKLQFDDSMDIIEGLCRNVSIGGMFIDFDHARPAGSLVRFELELDKGNAIRGLGEVVWMKGKSDFGGPDAGFGLKFRFLEQQDRQLIFKLVSQHIKDRLTRREPGGVEANGDSGSVEAWAPPAVPPPSVLIPPDPEPAPKPTESHRFLPIDPGSEPAEPAVAARVGHRERWAGSEPALGIDDDLAFGAPSPPDSAWEDGVLRDSAPGAPIDLDPSVGGTPLYELGLDHERPSSRFDEPDGRRPGSDEPESAEAPAEGLDAPFDEPAGTHREEEVDLRDDLTGGRASGARREFPLLPVLFIMLLAFGAGFYLYKDELMARFFGESPQSVPVASGNEAPGAEAASEVAGGGDPAGGEPPRVASPPLEAARVSPQTKTPSSPQTETPLATVAVAASPPIVPPSPEPSPKAETTVATGVFSRLEDISWKTVPGGLMLILVGDGPIPSGRYRTFHMAGDSPRDVIKLMGVRQGYGKTQIRVGGPGVQQIRTGLHRVDGQNELHVVIDLLGPRWKITEIRDVGSRLELLIKEE